MEQLLNIKEAAKFLSVKESWIRSAVFKQEIPIVKLGRLVRFRRSDLENFIKENLKSEIDISYEEDGTKADSWT